jgi:hypothetical protein
MIVLGQRTEMTSLDIGSVQLVRHSTDQGQCSEDRRYEVQFQCSHTHTKSSNKRRLGCVSSLDYCQLRPGAEIEDQKWGVRHRSYGQGGLLDFRELG